MQREKEATCEIPHAEKMDNGELLTMLSLVFHLNIFGYSHTLRESQVRGHLFMTSALRGGVRDLADFADKQY